MIPVPILFTQAQPATIALPQLPIKRMQHKRKFVPVFGCLYALTCSEVKRESLFR